MLTSTFLYGAPEWRLTNSAYADLYHYYGLPMWSTVGTDSHAFDQQAAMELIAPTRTAMKPDLSVGKSDRPDYR